MGRLYVNSVMVMGLLLMAITFPTVVLTPEQLVAFFLLTILAIISQFFMVEVPGRQSYYPHHAFFFASALLLAPFWLTSLIFITHMAELGKGIWRHKKIPKDWYGQFFNGGVFIMAGLAAHLLYFTMNPGPFAPLTFRSVFAATLATAIYVAVNYLLVALVLMLVERLSWQESGIFSKDSLLSDFVMAYMGYLIAVVWQLNAWLLLPVLSPLLPMYRSLMIPKLTQQAQIDGKTRLLNARAFDQRLTEELQSVRRRQTPLALIMADLDLLRNINNQYGHLAGDAVLAGIGGLIRQSIRLGDIAGRFGGEEFAIALPDVDMEDAYLIAERIRATIEKASFPIENNPTPIQVTMSLGIAAFPMDADTITSLIHCADLALYYAKRTGRNRVVCFTDLPYAVREAGIPYVKPAVPV
ncbi:MAG: GGDEF domain-containing protein [Caldilineaceae bacterium]